MTAIATPDWLWILVGCWIGSLVLLALLLWLNWPEEHRHTTLDELLDDDDE